MGWQPDAPLEGLSFCALDLETTGLHPALHRIVEVGMVRFDRHGVEDECSWLANPGSPMPPEATAIHGIGDADVAGSPPFENLLDGVLDYIGDRMLVIHNASFDLSFIAAALRRAGRPAPELWAIDTVSLSRRTWPGMRGYGLAALCTHFGIDLRHHRALGDARAAAALFRLALEAADTGGSWRLADLKRHAGKFHRMRPAAQPTDAGRGPLGTLAVGVDAVIRYRDLDGLVTTRTIRPREFFKQNGRLYVLAYCHLRESVRCFSADRIEW